MKKGLEIIRRCILSLSLLAMVFSGVNSYASESSAEARLDSVVEKAVRVMGRLLEVENCEDFKVVLIGETIAISLLGALPALPQYESGVSSENRQLFEQIIIDLRSRADECNTYIGI